MKKFKIVPTYVASDGQVFYEIAVRRWFLCFPYWGEATLGSSMPLAMAVKALANLEKEPK